MSEPFLGEIRMFAGFFAPAGWAHCDGQLIASSQNEALSSLFGATYGGDGITTFGLPDMRGRIPLHRGTGPGLSHYEIGSNGGTEAETLTFSQLPNHIHDGAAMRRAPQDELAVARSSHRVESRADLAAEPHTNLMPTLSVNFIVALVGLYPS